MSLASGPVYTSNQITAGAFFGGPLASSLMMRRNFLAFGDTSKASRTLVYGILSAIAILALVFVIPKQVPNTALSVAYTIAFRNIAKRFQMDKGALRLRGFLIHSNWRVAGISLLWFVLSALIIFAVVFALISVRVPLAQPQR